MTQPSQLPLPCRLMRTGLAICIGIALTGTAIAGEPKWPLAPVVVQAQERPIRDLLTDFFGSLAMLASISEGVRGRVSGRFDGKPDAVFEQLVKANNLLPYFDGAVMHISSADEVSGKSMPVSSREIKALLKTFARLDMVDRYQSVQILRDAGLIKIRGSRAFVQDVEDLINAQRKSIGQRAKRKVLTPTKVVAPPLPAPAPMTLRTFPLKFASAADTVLYQNGQAVTVPGMATTLLSMLGDASQLRPTRVGSSNRVGSVSKLRGKGLRSYGGGIRKRADVGTAPATAQIDSSSGAGYPGSRTNARVIADPVLNAVVVRDQAQSMPMYEQLIADLDKAPQLVEIQVTIIDVDKSRIKDLGFDWRYQGGRSSARLNGGPADQPDASTLLFNTVLDDARKFFARIHALQAEGAARITSRPQVMTISNMEAVLTNDQSFYVRVAGNEDVDLFNVSAGTALRVVPFVAGDEADPQIRLTVTIEDGTISDTDAVDGIPVVERSSLNTQAVIFNGENLLLGGLVRDRETTQTAKVPILGDIPALGRLFKHTSEQKSRTERLFLISPRIVRNTRAVRHQPTAPEQHRQPIPNPTERHALATKQSSPTVERSAEDTQAFSLGQGNGELD